MERGSISIFHSLQFDGQLYCMEKRKKKRKEKKYCALWKGTLEE